MLAGALCGGAAQAQEIRLKPLIDARPRAGKTSVRGVPHQAEAVTIRIRSGVEARYGPWSAPAEATLAISERYDGGTMATPPIRRIDSPIIELNRALRHYAGNAMSVAAGR